MVSDRVLSLIAASFAVRRELLTVIAPGIVTIVAVAALLGGTDLLPMFDAIATLSARWNLLASLGAVIGLVFAAYGVGFTNRLLGFALAGLLRRLRLISYPSPADLGTVLRGLAVIYGEPYVRDVFSAHPIRGLVEAQWRGDSSTSASFAQEVEQRRRVRAEMRGDPLISTFRYCKSWLTRWAPDLGVETHEFEINVAYSYALPLLLVFTDVARSVGGTTAIVVLVAALFGVRYLFERGVELTSFETWDALDHFIRAHAYARTDPHEATAP